MVARLRICNGEEIQISKLFKFVSRMGINASLERMIEYLGIHATLAGSKRLSGRIGEMTVDTYLFHRDLTLNLWYESNCSYPRYSIMIKSRDSKKAERDLDQIVNDLGLVRA